MARITTGSKPQADSPRGAEGKSAPDETTNPIIESKYHHTLLPTNCAKRNEAPNSTPSASTSETGATEEYSKVITLEGQPLIAGSIEDLPNGANFMVRRNGDHRLIPYKKDHFNGVIRRRQFMDDVYDKAKEEDPKKFAEYRRRFKKICHRARDRAPNPYARDPCSGAMPRRRLTDDFLDKIKAEDPAKFAEYARRHNISRARDSGRVDNESEADDSTDDSELADDETESDETESDETVEK
ncbi:hypothetical protein F5Y14DRAFT_448954 [Nemania sp. NC0429]|nr:hypothetical protein F5Y14DRAFT_448954 [Nemania sp. NC0429]